MAFDNNVLPEVEGTRSGEVIKSSPYNTSAFEQFEEGLVVGRFAKYDSDSVDNLDGSATPTIAGIVGRRIGGDLENNFYTQTGQAVDQVAEVHNFGFATVDVVDAATPTKFAPVYAINAAGADSGKATQDSGAAGALEITDAVFWEETRPGVWLVLLKQFV